MAAGITQDGAVEAIDPSHRSSNDGNDETHPDQVQPIMRNLMKSLLGPVDICDGDSIENQ